jgi:tetratricopeptide (TPR) repeat protein
MNTRLTLSAILSVAILGGSSLAAAPALASGDAYRRSYTLEAKRKYTAALRALASASGQSKRSYFHKLRLGWLSYLAGKHQQSTAAYKEAARLQPKALEPLLGLMLPQMALRAWLDASRTAKTALFRDEDNYTALSRLALCEYYLGRYASSAKRYRRALKLYPANLTMRVGLGWALLKERKRAAAKRVFGQVLAWSPDNSSAKQGLAAAR